MKRLLIASALLALASTASAQSPTAPAGESEAAKAADFNAAAERDAAIDRFCLQHTGSRITATSNSRTRERLQRCAPVHGRVYSQSDIDSTGAVELSDALRRLDPSIN
ncbi:hypothetical protein [Luteimonas vadosa]|uniref:Uncharacterized protein n=1 Tax=Luteimonas vadosa TaxID=1165507 RepID=A0ABP9E7J6_9GAMM